MHLILDGKLFHRHNQLFSRYILICIYSYVNLRVCSSRTSVVISICVNKFIIRYPSQPYVKVVVIAIVASNRILTPIN